jgi:hypothetical protein
MIKTKPVAAQYCAIATQAQIDAAELLNRFINFENPDLYQEALHEMLMGWLFFQQGEGEELDPVTLNLYKGLHTFLSEAAAHVTKYGTSTFNAKEVA